MARVFLVNPPSPEPVKSPLLSFCHLAASLRGAGHEVAIHDASAPYAPRSHTEIAERIAAFAPDFVGLHLKTLHVQPAYALANDLAKRFVLVAGGPHATIVPSEPLAHGFRWVIRGEGEDALVELADVFDGKRDASSVAGLTWIHRGMERHNPARAFNTELDRLAPPLSALDLFDPSWYELAPPAGRVFPPVGILSSRGCPQACTFCSNDVTGRKFRYRSAPSVAGEIAELGRDYGLTAFSFFDDSFAVGRRRVKELCDAIVRAQLPIAWTCTAHPAHLDREVIADMKRAGCGGIDIGMESADPEMLLRIGKGVTVERVLDVLGWAKELDVHTVVNLMFGWPDETDAELESTIAFMVRAAPVAGGFNARGVVVPYPGTAIYENNHERFGFTRWWLDETPLAYVPFPASWDEAEIVRAYGYDPALDRNFFRHPPHRVERIRAALVEKAERTMEIQMRRIAELTASMGVPAAGAR
ncbi:MAG: B12-binding domain-containing radical SAM protein [Kofleriaceae bacterium]